MNPFTSGHHRSQWVLLLFSIFTVLAIISIVYTFIEIDLLQQEINGDNSNASQRQTIDDRQDSIYWYYLMFTYVSGISFLVWLYRVNSNLPSLGMQYPKFSSGWAVGWFFVPIFNLFRPYKVVTEIYTGSDPKLTAKPETQNNNNWNQSLVFWWWATILILFAVRFVMAIYAVEAEDSLNYVTDYEYLNHLENIKAHRYALIVSRFADIAAFLPTILLVRIIDKRQKAKHEIVVKASPGS